MKKKNLVLALFIMFLGFGFMLNVHAEIPEPQITATNMLSTQIRVNYKLSSCGEYKTCGVVLINLNWYYRNDYAIVLRAAGDGYKTYDGLNKGETYAFKVAVYWFDDDGKYHMSLPGEPLTIKAQAPTSKTPTKLDITTAPTKTEYIEGETFDPTGMKLKVTYNMGDSTEIQDGKGCTFSPSKIEKDTTQIRITCEGVYATQSIKASEKTIEEITEITSKPNKVIYEDGEYFEPTGMKIKVKYNNEITEEVEVTKDICKFIPDKLTVGTDKVTIECGNTQTNVDVTVKEKEKEVTLENISIKTEPTKKEYIEGEKFNSEGMVITYKYSDGTTVDKNVSEEVSNNKCTIDPSGELSKNDTKVTITCSGKSVDQNITVKAKEVTLENISIKNEPKKKEYIEGEKFNSEGMVITYKYSDGTTVDKNVSEEVSNNKCTIDPSGELSKNDTKVTITCSGKSVDQNITVVNKYITGITAKTPAAKTIYQEGETFDPTGMEVEATYNDNSKKTLNIKEEIENGTCTFSPNTPLTKDVTSVKITCTGNIEITQQITVKETVTVSVVVQNGTVETPSKTIDYNTNTTFNITPTQEDYTYGYVSCTNNQTGTYNNKVLTLKNVTKDTTCTVKLVNEMTTLYNDGTLIINEQLKDRSTNIEKHGTFTNEYVAMDSDNSYVFDCTFSTISCTPWYNERKNVKSVEIGKTIKPTSTAYWFYAFVNMEKGDFANLDTSQVTNMKSMFNTAGYDVTAFNLDLSSWDTSKVANMHDMFRGAGSSYKTTTWSIGGLSNWNTSQVTDMGGMFTNAGGDSTTTFNLDLSSWDTSNVTDMNGMFYQAGQKATTFNLDLSNWDTSNVTDMMSMFDGAGRNAITWNIGGISNWNTSSVTNMSGMFYAASQKATIFNLDLSGWDTSKVTNMSNMFRSAGQTATTFNLDLSNWDTSSITNMSSIFSGAGSSATTWTVKIPSTTGSLTNTTSKWYGSSEDIYAEPDSGKYFTLSGSEVKKALTSIEIKDLPTKTEYIEGELFDPTGMTLNGIYSDETTEVLNVKDEVEKGTCEIIPNTALTSDITSVKIKCNDLEVTQDITVKKMVTASIVVQNGTTNSNFKKIEYNTDTTFDITPIGEDYTSAHIDCTNNQTGTYDNKVLTLNNVTSDTTCTVKLVNEMTTLYTDGTLIINEQLKDRSTNISKHGAVTNKYVAMDSDNSYTFNSSSVIWKNERINVKSVEIGKTIKPTSTAYWFDELTNMEKGDFTNLDTSNVTDMSYMFYNAGKNVLSFKLNLSNLNTSKVTDMSHMFYNAGASASTWNVGDLSSWDTSNVTNMMQMFNSIGQNSKTWTLGNISNWNTSKVTDMSGMFSYVGKNITTFNLDLSRWDTSNVTNMGGMFTHAGAYSTDFNLILDGWDTSKVTSMVQMFAYAGAYEAETFNLDLSRWDTSSVTNMYNMFESTGENTEALSWTISIPKKTGTLSNTGERLYGASETIYGSNPSFAKKFTLS